MYCKFSSNNRLLLNKVEKFIKYIVRDEGFTINEKRLDIISNDVKNVTGITINDDSIHVDKTIKSQSRAQIFQTIKAKDYTPNREILGKIAYVSSIED